MRASQPQFRLQRWLATALGGLHVTPKMATALVLITIGLATGIMVWRTTIDTSRHQAQNSEVVGVQPSSAVNRAGTHRDSDITDRPNSADDNAKIQPASAEGGGKEIGVHLSAAGRADRRRIKRLPVAPTVDQVTLRVERQYLSAIKILSGDIKRRRALISPALLSQLEMALAEVDRNIAATRRVARERDPVAVQYLASAYENKLDLLREVSSW